MGFHAIVCIKSVVLNAPGGKITRTPDSVAFNPFDLAALETALAARDEADGAVTVLSMGPMASAQAVYTALSLGADRGVLLCDKALAGSDTLATSTALCAAIKKLAPFDIVLFGTKSADSDSGQVGPQTASALDIPMAAQSSKILFRDGGVEVESESDGFISNFFMKTPCALTVSQNAAKARDAGLMGIQTAFDKDIEIWGLDNLELLPDQVGDQGSPTVVKDMTTVSKGKKCEFIPGSVDEQAQQLLEKLNDMGLIK